MENDIILETVGLTKRFGSFVAVQDVNLKIKEGSIHALIGPNGAGKTTYFNMLSKFLPATAGKILFRGRDITSEKPSNVACRGIVRSFQISSVFANLTVLENVRLSLQRKRGDQYYFWRSERALDDLNERAVELLRNVDLAAAKSQRAADLSYGRKRALELATTLALEPEIMLLDEPMAGLGSEDIQKVSKLIRASAAGRTVVMVEHNLKVIEELSDRITVLNRGRVLTEGTYQEVSGSPAVAEAYMGLTND